MRPQNSQGFVVTGASTRLANKAVTLLRSHPYAVASIATGAALALTALVNYRLAKKAERDNPPMGRVVELDGVRLHFVERGKGEPLILLHGNGSMIQDFESSGLIDMAAAKYRVIAFDRPGYGHSDRPRTTVWTAEKQADLIRAALVSMGVQSSTVLGHSWGCSVAIALALKYPECVRSLVLASGYYYPSARLDVVALAQPAVPVIGDVIRYSVSPILSRLMWPRMTRKLFWPAGVPGKYHAFPKELAFRPSQIRASAAESALMIPHALAVSSHYPDLKMPVVILAGAQDQLVDADDQSARLHADVAHSAFHRLPGVGHMVHQTATSLVMAAIDEAAKAARSAVAKRPLAAA
jgi:pimeloyl-ACP methyl ester carboxylesterase